MVASGLKLLQMENLDLKAAKGYQSEPRSSSSNSVSRERSLDHVDRFNPHRNEDSDPSFSVASLTVDQRLKAVDDWVIGWEVMASALSLVLHI